VVGPIVALALGLGPQFGWPLEPDNPRLNYAAAVAVLMAVWWMTDAIPLAATSLLPLALFPLLGVMSSREVAPSYADPLMFLYLGGFMIALAIEDSGLHRRIALVTVRAIGDSPRQVVAGFMLATAVLSMWISNTATTVMMLPIAGSILLQADAHRRDERSHRNLGIALMLGIAYAASIGGIASLIGTPTNIAFAGFWNETYTTRTPITIYDWLPRGLPFVIPMLAIAWAVLVYRVFPLGRERFLGGREVIGQLLSKLGRLSRHEIRIGALFLFTAGLWILRPFLIEAWVQWVNEFGWFAQYQWDAADLKKQFGDETVAVVMATLCFLIPTGTGDGRRLLDQRVFARVPWHLIVLFGGGFALAAGMHASGLDAWLGYRLADALGDLPGPARTVAVAGGMTALTELTSNVASLQMALPVLAGTSERLAVDPLLLMVPATLAASCAFMLPVATPPNAVVFGSGRIEIADMIRGGLWLNLIGVALITTLTWLLM